VDPDILVGTSGVPPLVSSLIKQHDEMGIRALLIDDGLGWVGEWYDITGKSSNYVVDQIPQFASEKAKKWAADFKTKFGIEPSPSAGGQVFDMTNFFIKIANTSIAKYGEMTSETLYKTGQEMLWTGQLVYTEGLIHTRYEYNKESIPDPVVGKGYFIFPVLQYMDGKSVIVWPDDVAAGKLQQKPIK
jgi:branched-chain amino acid transport system substrate-binding protein